MDLDTINPLAIYQRLAINLEKVIKGQVKAIRKLLAVFASGGHVLLEDLPGTGQTTLAKALARSLQLEFQEFPGMLVWRKKWLSCLSNSSNILSKR